MRSISLRSRLALGAVGVLAVALGLVGAALDAANRRGAESALQARMESYVYVALAAMEVDAEAGLQVQDDFADPRLSQPGSGLYLEVSGGGRSWRSASALGVELPATGEVPAGRMEFSPPTDHAPLYSLRYGIGWQLENGRIAPFTVSVMADPRDIGEQTGAFRLGLWRALVTAGGILALAVVILLYLGFRPLGLVAREVAEVESGRRARLEGPYPRELEPLARNVNRLLDTEQSNQQRIRNALDSLAHSLKTPLAVIQAGLPLHGDPAGSMQNAVDEMQRLIATRLERAGLSARRALAAPVPVAPQLQRVLDSLTKVHSRRLITAELNVEEGLAFYGEQRDLLELLGNLLDNAFKYGGGRLRVSAGAIDPDRTRPGLWLSVEDDGPGIDAADAERLLQRGVRGDERIEGHGLGLAIVSELVTAYGGTVGIGPSGLGGAEVRVELPAS